MEQQHCDPPTMRYWQVKVAIRERSDGTLARVTLRVDPAHELEAAGHSTRNEHDPVVPRIGDEVAVARALRALADRLLERAAVDIEHTTGELDVSLR